MHQDGQMFCGGKWKELNLAKFRWEKKKEMK